MSKPTGRLRWMLVKLDEDKPHPVAIKLQMEVGGQGIWEDVPLVNGDGNYIADFLHMPAWKMT